MEENRRHQEEGKGCDIAEGSQLRTHVAEDGKTEIERGGRIVENGIEQSPERVAKSQSRCQTERVRGESEKSK